MPAPVTNSLQYQQFIDFASSKGVWRNTLLMSQNTGGNLSIVAKPRSDFIGNLRRDSGSQRVNNDIREAFKQSVIDLFGVGRVDQLPESVQTAMKLDDYGQGKPLSVRRILAVKAAVDQQLAGLTKSLQTSFDFFNDVFAYNKAHHPEDLAHVKFQHYEINSDHQKLIRAALTACKGDMEAYELIRSNMYDLVNTREQGEIESKEDEVKSRVGKILANLHMLRQEVGKDLKLYNAIKPFLWPGRDVDLPKARLREMVNAVKDLDVSALLSLTQNASSKAIHDAATKLEDLLKEAFSKITPPDRMPTWIDEEYKKSTRAYVIFTQVFPDDGDLLKNMLASMIFAKAFPNDGDLLKVQKKLMTRPATKLMKYYKDSNKSDAWDNLEQLKELVDKCCDSSLHAIVKPIKPFSGTVTARDVGLE